MSSLYEKMIICGTIDLAFDPRRTLLPHTIAFSSSFSGSYRLLVYVTCEFTSLRFCMNILCVETWNRRF